MHAHFFDGEGRNDWLLLLNLETAVEVFFFAEKLVFPNLLHHKQVAIVLETIRTTLNLLRIVLLQITSTPILTCTLRPLHHASPALLASTSRPAAATSSPNHHRVVALPEVLVDADDEEADEEHGDVLINDQVLIQQKLKGPLFEREVLGLVLQEKERAGRPHERVVDHVLREYQKPQV